MPLKGKEMIELLTGYKEEGVSFEFLQKAGLRYDFEATGIQGDDAVSLVKKLIQSTPYGSAIYFSVSVG
jgi:hypothetical protein